MSDHPRLGISVSPSRHLPVDAVLEIAGRAEVLGYDSIWVPETWGIDLATVLALLVRRTSVLRVASGVFNVFSRSAMVLAQTAATLQTLSRGRFILGLGASGPIVVNDWHGMPYDRPLERTREYVAAIRLALSGQRVDYRGEIIRLKAFHLGVPATSPVPIYLAALGPRNIRLAGEIADGWLPIFAPRHLTPRLLAELTEGTRVAGRREETIDVAAYLPAVFGPRSDRLLRTQMAYYLGGMGTFYAEFARRAGFVAAVDQIRGLWQAGDRLPAIGAVTEDLLATRTLGTDPSTALSRLADYRTAGIALPIIALPHGCSLAEILTTLEALAPRPSGGN